MTTPDIYQDEESGDLDVFVPPQFTAELLEFLRGKVPFFGVTIEAVDTLDDDEEEVDTSETDADEETDEEETDEEGDEEEETSEPLDAFSFPGDVDEATLAALLEEFFAAK